MAYLSTTRYRELVEKLDRLKNVDLKHILNELQTAIETGGGMHDNASYESSVIQRDVLIKQITECEAILRDAKVFEPGNVDTRVVSIGTTISVENLADRSEEEFDICAAYEEQYADNEISYLSPLGRAFLGKSVGDKVVVVLPRGRISYNVLGIRASPKKV